MSTAHKLQDEWLLSYAAGALSPARSLMVASHVSFHDDLQETVADAETIGGALLSSMDTSDVDERILDELLMKLEDVPVPETKKTRSGLRVPEPLVEFLDTDIDSLNWRFAGRGLQQARLWDGPKSERLWLLRARGGVVVPEHGHTGEEWTLVLKGAYNTYSGRYGVGSIDLADEEVTHQPLIEADEECICLVMTEGPVRLSSLTGRLVQPFVGI